MNEDKKNVLAGMTADEVSAFLAKASNVQDALIELGIEFIKRTKQNTLGMEDFDSWRFEDNEAQNGLSYAIVYSWYCMGEYDDTTFCIPYRAIDDMDGAVAEYFEEKTRQEEKAKQKKFTEELAAAQEKEQAEYEEYLRLKEKFGNHQ